jgi:glycosyltransferase involved in cell wall biosynthesis
MPDTSLKARPVHLAYIGCWYKDDMYSHNCSNFVESLRGAGMKVDVITSNCRCFSSAQSFAVTKSELINENCSAVAIPHAPHDPGRRHGTLKRLVVKVFRLDLWLATVRGFLYYQRTRHADVIHFDQVLEAFGCIPLLILVMLAGITKKRVVVAVHEIDPFQRKHRWVNRFYNKCAEVLVYSEHMKQQLVHLGASPDKIKTIKYGASVPELIERDRKNYLYFGGHNILSGKGYVAFLDSLTILQSRDVKVHMVIYVGHGCNGLQEAQKVADSKGVSGMIDWQEFYTGDELAKVYQASKACIVPFTGGSARHPLTCAMVNATPVIATRAVDIPEYLGDLGIYVDGSANSIADAICRMEEGSIDVTTLGKNLRAKALAELDYQKIAEELSGMYSRMSGTAKLVQLEPVA